jgi:hypothetical protein
MIVLAGATLLSGIIQGRMSRRWGGLPELQELGGKLKDLPTEIGPWRMQASRSLAPAAVSVLECAGYVSRQYENRQTGEVVSMAVILGPAGPISVHTPDVCYAGQDYNIHHPPVKTTLSPEERHSDELWRTTLHSKALGTGYLRVYYGWSTGGRWSAPSDARLAFAGQRYLYKLQVADGLLSPVDENASAPCSNFLKELLPVLKQYLVEPAKE